MEVMTKALSAFSSPLTIRYMRYAECRRSITPDVSDPIAILFRYICMLKCVCLQNFISHYRRRLFELLCSSDEVYFTIASDNQSESTGIEVGDLHASKLRWRLCIARNVMRSRLYWHPQFINFVRREKPDAIIAIGNPYVLTAWALLLWGRL